MKISIPIRSAASVILMFYGVSTGLAAAGPQAVWCHKSDGRIDLEFENVPGECNCEECSLCREHRLLEILGLDWAETILKALHCRHEEILSAPACAAAPEKRNIKIKWDFALLRGRGPAGFVFPVFARSFPTERPSSKAPPPLALSLRC